MHNESRLADDNEYWLRASRLMGAGPLRRVVLHFESIERIRAAPVPALVSTGLSAEAARELKLPGTALRDCDAVWLAEPLASVLPLTSPQYPRALREIADPPALLFISGDVACLSRPQVAIVGTRRPTPTGLSVARELASGLSANGVLVTSGLASGIDSAAHEGALEGVGGTIAVLGCGIDRVYPHRNRHLARRIANAGALVSEFPPSTAPLPAYFPQRNRIISGLAAAVVVVEAARRSGSLITARLAAEQGRDVLAVPGSVRSPVSAGCHALLRDGAGLVESVDDVLREVFPGAHPQSFETVHGTETRDSDLPDPGERVVLDVIGYEPVTVDELVDRSGLTPQELSSILLRLELVGIIHCLPGGLVSRTASALLGRPNP